MERLERASVMLDNIERNARILGVSIDDILKMTEGEWWKNSVYTVVVRDLDGADRGVHLSVRRNDREPIHDWRDLQQIKNQILGDECEAVELYPAESRRVDAANQFHLWGSRRRKFRFNLGFFERLVVDDGAIDAEIGSKQRAFANGNGDDPLTLLRELRQVIVFDEEGDLTRAGFDALMARCDKLLGGAP